MLLDTILPPKGEADFFLKKKLQLVAVSDTRMGLGATVEDVVYNLIPGVASRSVLLPVIASYQALYSRALDDVSARVKAAKGKVLHVDRARATIRCQYRTEQDLQQDTLYVRLLHTDVAFMQIATEAMDHAEDPPVNFTEVRAQIAEIITRDEELPETARRTLLTRSRNPAFPVSALTIEYARVKKDRALLALAERYAPTCARAGYAALRELVRSPLVADVTPGGYAMPGWWDLPDADRQAIVAVTTKVICGQTTPFQHGEQYGPLFLGVIQQCLMHFVGSAAQYERERVAVAEIKPHVGGLA